jgi:hypothetical protein
MKEAGGEKGHEVMLRERKRVSGFLVNHEKSLPAIDI